MQYLSMLGIYFTFHYVQMLVIFCKMLRQDEENGSKQISNLRYCPLVSEAFRPFKMINMGSLLVRVGILFVVFLPSQYLKYPKVGLNNHGIVKNGLGGIRTLDLTLRRHPRCPFCAFYSLRYEPLSIKQQ